MRKASLQPVDTGLVTVDALPLLDELALRQHSLVQELKPIYE